MPSIHRIIKEERRTVEFFKTSAALVEQKLHSLQQTVPWLQFQKKQQHGYQVFPIEDHQHEVLHGLVKELHAQFPEWTKGEVAESLTFLINTHVKDMVPQQKGIHKAIQDYLEQPLITAVGGGVFIPRNFQLMIANMQSQKWQGLDITNNKQIEVIREESPKYINYFVMA